MTTWVRQWRQALPALALPARRQRPLTRMARPELTLERPVLYPGKMWR